MKNSVILTLNLLLMLVYASLAVLTPVYEYQKMVYLLAVFFFWYVTALVIEKNWLRISLYYLLFLVSIIILDYICGWVNNDEYTMMDGVNKAPVFCWSLFVLFYSRHLQNIRPYVGVLLLFLIVSSVFTLSGNIIIPGASRLLAGTNDFYMEDRLYLRKMFVGGYDFIYCLVFSIFPLIIWSRNNSLLKKTMVYLSIMLFLVTIVLGAYMIGILMATLSIIISFVNINRTSVVRILLIIVFIIIFKDVMLKLLESVGEQYDIAALVKHSEDLSTGSYYAESNQENNRISIYLGSIRNWLQSPIFGHLIGRPTNLVRAGHSEMLSFLERYGVFSLVYFFFFRRFYLSVKKCIDTVENQRYFKLFFFLFIIFGFLDRFDRSYGIGFMVFFLGPLLFMLKDLTDKEKSDKLINN